MSEIANLIKELKEHGIGLKVIGDNLEVSLFKDDVDEAIFDQLRAKKPEIIAYINSLEVKFKHEPIKRSPRKDVYSLSNAQLRIWVANKFDGASRAYNVPEKVYVEDEVNMQTLKMAILKTIERHEILRTIFVENNEHEIQQKVIPIDEVDFPINFVDLRKSQKESVLENHSQEELLQNFMDEGYLEPFDLTDYPLFRINLFQLDEKRYVLYYIMHHIICDGWSSQVFSRDVLAFYDHLSGSSEKTNTLNELTIQYKDYAEWQRGQMKDDSNSKQRAYWLDYLSGELPRLDFPLMNRRPLFKTFDGHRFVAFLGADITNKLKAYVEDNGGTLFMGLLTAWNILCQKYTHQRDIIIGTLITGRDHPDLQNQIGYYVNTMALRNNLEQSDNFDSFFQKVKENTLNCYQHQSYPFDHLVDELQIDRESGRSAIFDVMLTMDNIEDDISSSSQVMGNEIIDDGYIATKFDIDVNFQEVGGGVSFQVVFNTDLYSSEMIKRVMNNYQRLLKMLLENRQERIDQLDFLSEKEKSQLLFDFNKEVKETQFNKGVAELFEQQVSQSPDNIAVVFSKKNEDGRYEERKLTYDELSEMVNRFAIYLKQTHRIESRDSVGIIVKRSEWSIISMLSLLKLGCAYVPIDPMLPQKRVDFIKSDANLRLTIDDQIILNYFSDNTIDDSAVQSWRSDPDDLAYVIYTSGTSGSPKGVMIQQKSMLDYVLTFKDYFNVNEKDKVIHQSSISFDTHIEEIFPAILSGACVLIGENGKGDISELEHQVMHNGATILSTTPWVLREINKSNADLGSLRLLISGGDVFSVSFVSNYLGKIDVYDTYGPSETTVCATAMKIKSEEDDKLIGQPFNNTTVHILGDNAELLPVGALGEICIGGNGLAKGYLNLPQLTEEKFISNPFSDEGMLFKTGDLGRWTEEGSLQFVGRKDDQVKIRGYRIEKEEIRVCLLKHPKIKEALIDVTKNKHQEQELLLYFTLNETAELDSKLKGGTYDTFLKTELKEFLRETLPEYMIPKRIIQLSEIPLTTSGKVNRKLISEESMIKSEAEDSVFMGPRDSFEEWVSMIFQQVLEVEQIDIRSSFFSVGGNSLSAIRLISRIQKQYDIKLDIETLFRASTIEQIGNLIKLTIDNEDVESEHFKI
ncbi:MAG: amino acid adenylation domain-containing protein [Crocinitomicaceae bacterium]